MSRSTRVVRAFLLVSALGAAATLGACTDASTAPRPRSAVVIQRTNDATPPDSTCFSGWMVVDGRWVCAPT